MTKTKAYILFTILLVLLCLEFYNFQFFQLPYGVHEWANSERLALAFGYFDTGMNFFKPSTYNQNSIQGICGHEFPIQSYIAALLAQFFGRNSITQCYRAIDIVIFCIGMFSLFTITFQKTQKFLLALVPIIFLCASPMFVDYSGGFLPDPASSSIVFMSFIPIFGFLERQSNKYIVRAILLMTLATLIKTSSIIYLAGFLLFLLISFVQQRKNKSSKDWAIFLTTSILGVAIVFAYYLYNAYLNETYKSGLFLAKPIPFENWDDVSFYFSKSVTHGWMDEYFNLPAYLFFVALVSAAIPIFKKSRLYSLPLKLAACFFVFLLPVFWAMGHQLHAHDYYIISMFFPLLLWMVVWSVIAINNEIKETSVAPIFYSCIFGSLLILYCFSDFTNYTRLNIDNPKQANWTRVHWLKNGAAIMDKLGIPKNENILALNENSPNETLVYFDRKGYIYESGRWYDGNSIAVEPFMKERNLTIAVVETKAFRERILSDSLIFRNFSELYSDENATVLKLKTY